jgi:hypothetical protein
MEEFCAFILTVIVGVLGDIYGYEHNIGQLGQIVATALMGSIILWNVRRKK